MRIIADSNGEWYQVIEELECPLKECKHFIILKNDDIFYWQNANNYYVDKMLDVEMMKEYISEIETTRWRSELRKQKTLTFQKENLSKMIAHKRQIKIEEVLDKTNKEDLWLYC